MTGEGDFRDMFDQLDEETANKKGIAEKLDIDDIEPLEVEKRVVVFDKNNPENDVISDYELVRLTLISMISTGEAVLNQTLKDIRLNPGPRTVEGISTLIKTIGDQTDKIITLHEKTKKIRPVSDNDDDGVGEKKNSVKATLTEIIDML